MIILFFVGRIVNILISQKQLINWLFYHFVEARDYDISEMIYVQITCCHHEKKTTCKTMVSGTQVTGNHCFQMLTIVSVSIDTPSLSEHIMLHYVPWASRRLKSQAMRLFVKQTHLTEKEASKLRIVSTLLGESTGDRRVAPINGQ